MELTKSTKKLMAIVTGWIVLYPLLFLAVWLIMAMSIFFTTNTQNEQMPFMMLPLFAVLFPMHCLTIILQIGLAGVYVFHIIKNTNASDVMRIIFGIGVFFMPYIAMPIYFYFFIWKEEPPDWGINKEQVIINN